VILTSRIPIILTAQGVIQTGSKSTMAIDSGLIPTERPLTMGMETDATPTDSRLMVAREWTLDIMSHSQPSLEIPIQNPNTKSADGALPAE
jgi:hypothetical protein